MGGLNQIGKEVVTVNDNKFGISYLQLTSYGSTIGCRTSGSCHNYDKVPAYLKLPLLICVTAEFHCCILIL